MYQFVTGPLAWIAFAVFFVGLIVRDDLVHPRAGLAADRVSLYRAPVSMASRARFDPCFLARSLGTHGWRFYPGYTVLVFVFHIGLLFTPIFLLAHNLMLRGAMGRRVCGLCRSAWPMC